jgi:hypothetical protein
VLIVPIAQALLLFALALVASTLVAIPFRVPIRPLALLVRAAIVFVGSLLLWLAWASADGPAWLPIELAGATWPLGVLASLNGATALAVELLARRLHLVEPRALESVRVERASVPDVSAT